MPQDTPMAISATGDPIHFMFGSRVGFLGSADRMAHFWLGLYQIQDGGRPPSWKISNGRICATGDPIFIWQGWNCRGELGVEPPPVHV